MSATQLYFLALIVALDAQESKRKSLSKKKFCLSSISGTTKLSVQQLCIYTVIQFFYLKFRLHRSHFRYVLISTVPVPIISNITTSNMQ